MKYILPALLFCVVIFSCKKDEDDPPPPTNTQMLTTGSWKFQSGGFDVDMNGTIDLDFASGILPACVLDNTATFSTNGTGVADEGATKCDAGDPQTVPFTWAFTSNETKVNFTGSGLFGVSGEFSMLELSDVKLTFSKDTSIGLPTTSRLVINLQH